jgi:hypothetical protein
MMITPKRFTKVVPLLLLVGASTLFSCARASGDAPTSNPAGTARVRIIAISGRPLEWAIRHVCDETGEIITYVDPEWDISKSLEIKTDVGPITPSSPWRNSRAVSRRGFCSGSRRRNDEY